MRGPQSRELGPNAGRRVRSIRARVVSATVFERTLDLREPYAIAYQDNVGRARILFLRVEISDGLVGWGSSAPDADVIGETPEDAAKALNDLAADLEGGDAWRIGWWHDRFERRHPASPSARAAASIALYDLLGKRARMPLYRLLGFFRPRIVTSVTIGLMDVDRAVRAARRRVKEGFRILKIKGGRDWREDARRVLEVREAVGTRVKIRFDANQGYSPEDALSFIRAVGRQIELLEQPTHAQHLFSLKEVTSRSPVPIMADESILTFADSFRIAQGEAADMVNLKLMKVGGIRTFLKANSVAEAAGLEAMVGCMDESRISIAAALHLALATKNVEMADLDGHLDLVGDPARGGVVLQDGYLLPVDAPGLGVEVELG